MLVSIGSSRARLGSKKGMRILSIYTMFSPAGGGPILFHRFRWMGSPLRGCIPSGRPYFLISSPILRLEELIDRGWRILPFKAGRVERSGVENLAFKQLNQVECGSLTRPFLEAEVKEAVWDCDSFKSPGPDGILDGILIANEVVDEARKFKKELLLFKVDFEKAYDSVDWGYLDAVMAKMAFPPLWRKWIRECVCTATASVLVNGSPTEEFHLERGLRQGDPLSPFLFLLVAEGLNVMMSAMVERNVFTGYNVGEQESITVSLLQFADDTLLLGAKSWANVRALRGVLVLFELMSDLKVNFHKSMLVRVNITNSWLHEAASALQCRVGKVSFLYLGLPIGGDSRRLSFWEPVLTRIRNKLSRWNSRFLSFGGRLVLLKSVLTSLPVYALSFFKAPAGKWCWRSLVDKGGLWFRVLAARYGVDRGRLRDGGRRGSSWWREIVSIQDGVEGIGGGWFIESVAKRWGMAEMFFAGWEVGGEAWVWRRQLRVWEEEMLGECQSLLLSITVQAQTPDVWRWQPDPDTGYSVRGAYQLLTSQDSFTLGAVKDLVWHKQVPLKISICVWRLLRDKIPTKSNLVARGIISSEDQFCVSGCGGVESAQHLFLSCSTFGSMWALARSWIDFSAVDAHTLPAHFVQFTYSVGGLCARQSFLQLIWLAYVWVLWNERNHRLFRNVASPVTHLLEKVKMFSFRWLKSTHVTLASNYHTWWSNSLLCLGID
ncbi:hypothetical protein QL285_074404 [Trifolium repens]|nr:hypothetical protein QL285_074404 [Trifolium repens]